jgi:hypothetical protein
MESFYHRPALVKKWLPDYRLGFAFICRPSIRRTWPEAVSLGMTTGDHLNTSETRSREAVLRLPHRLARPRPRLTQIQEKGVSTVKGAIPPSPW